MKPKPSKKGAQGQAYFKRVLSLKRNGKKQDAQPNTQMAQL